MGGFAILLFFVFLLGIYLLPTIVAFMREKDNKVPILLLNLFLGWSLIAWVIALIWATSKDAAPQQVIINNSTNND